MYIRRYAVVPMLFTLDGVGVEYLRDHPNACSGLSERGQVVHERHAVAGRNSELITRAAL